MKGVAISTTVVILAFSGIALFYGTTYSVHQDLAGGVLTGKLAVELGEAFWEYNFYFPPIEYFWFSIAARVSDTTGLGADAVVLAHTFFAVLISAFLGFRIRQKTAGASHRFFIVSFLLLLTIPILYKNVFGLREHMVVLGLWPYLVFRASSENEVVIGTRFRVTLGAWLGFTLLFKYLYCIVVLFIEIADAIAQRKPLLLFRAENLIAATIVFVYLVLWLGIDPSQREAISAMLESITASFRSGPESVLRALTWVLVALAFLLAARRFRADPRLLLIGLAAVVGTMAAAWMQNRWYSHHLFPIVMAWTGWWWLVGAPFPRWAHVVIIGCFALVVQDQFLQTRIYQLQVAHMEEILELEGVSMNGKRVALLTQHPSPYNQLIASQGGLRWTPLMNIAYVSAELQIYDTPENEGKLPPPVQISEPGPRMLHDQLLQLWEDFPPDILILDSTYRWPLRYIDVDWKHVLSEDQKFNEIMQGFTPIFAHDTPLLKFEYYVRSN